MARRKPFDPAKALKAENERREQLAEIERLKASGAEVTLDRGGKLISARRSNVFNLLLTRGSITQNHYDAAYTLANDWAAWKGLDGKGDTMGELVDGSSGCREIVTDRMIAAGRRVADAIQSLSPTAHIIVRLFMVATVEEDRPMAWRGIMERAGVTGRDVQAGAMRDALEQLRAYYEEPNRRAAA